MEAPAIKSEAEPAASRLGWLKPLFRNRKASVGALIFAMYVLMAVFHVSPWLRRLERFGDDH